MQVHVSVREYIILYLACGWACDLKWQRKVGRSWSRAKPELGHPLLDIFGRPQVHHVLQSFELFQQHSIKHLHSGLAQHMRASATTYNSRTNLREGRLS